MYKLIYPNFLMAYPTYQTKKWYQKVLKNLRYNFSLMVNAHYIRLLEQQIQSNTLLNNLFYNQTFYGKVARGYYQGYLDRKFSPKKRYEILSRDLNLATQYFPKDFFDAGSQGITLAKVSDEFSIILKPNPLNCIEGIWCLELCYQEELLYMMTFSIGLAEALYIGSLQGGNQADSKGKIRLATKALHGLRPQQLMVWLAWTVAEWFGFQAVYGLSSQNHPLMGLVRRMRNKRLYEADYDSIWSSYHAVKRADGNWQIPNLVNKPLEEIESKKRSMYRKRYEMLAGIKNNLKNNFNIV